MERLYEKFNIPKRCIVENTIFKKAFLENTDLNSSDKKIINEHIKKVVWKYCLKPDTINIQPYRSGDRDYLEIEIIEVQLNNNSKMKRIAEIIMRAIPYPILLVFTQDEKIQLAVGDMRKNLNDSSKVTVDDFVFTDWIELSSKNEIDVKLLNDLNILKLNYSNFYRIYKDITEKINIYNISQLKGGVLNDNQNNMSEIDIKQCYDEIQLIEKQITKLKTQVKKSDSIKEKVELNVQIDKLRKQKAELMSNIQ